ncbi:MAG: hypothetical protein J6X21_03830 [Bacteroidaceae bacterium]|nr:hypothetical protein [Bacteroidaceae bacterium]
MKKFLSVVTLTLPLLTAYGQGTESSNSTQPEKIRYGQELFLQNLSFGSDNPVSIASNPYTLLNDFNVSYSRGTGSFMPVDGSGKAGLTDIDIYGVKKLNTISFEGSMHYGVHDLQDSRWNNTVLLSENNPFIIADSLVYYKTATHADSIPNDQNRELFTLSGGFAWQVSHKFLVGLRAVYKVGSKADESDPRFEAHGARVLINPGAEYSLSDRIALGLSFDAEVYHETVSMSVMDNLLPGHENTFLFQELGKYVVEQSGKRRYDGSRLGGFLQFKAKGTTLSDLFEAGLVMNTEKADDGATSFTRHGGDYSEYLITARNRFCMNRPSAIHNLILSASMTYGSAKWYKQKARIGEFGQTLYDILSKEVVQKQNDMSATLSYRFDHLSSRRPVFTAIVNAGAGKVSVNQYPDGYFARYTLANAGAELSRTFFVKDFSFSIGLTGNMTKDISALQYELPTATGTRKVMNSYFIPKYEYLGAGFWNTGATADASYRIKRQDRTLCYCRLGAGYSYTGYTGSYSRFDDRRTVSVRASLLF